MNIVSLLPSATEILHFLELTDHLKGISHDCDWPPEVRDLPRVSATNINEDASSNDIDRQVRDSVHSGKSIYHLDRDRLEQLQPDLILTQELCDVCAPAFDDVREASRWMNGTPQIISLEPESIEGILQTILTVGEATNRKEKSKKLVSKLQQNIQNIRTKTNEIENQKKVLCLEWLDPLYSAGHWVPEMVEVAGGQPFTNAGSRSKKQSLENLRSYEADAIILMPCGFSQDETEQEFQRLRDQKKWPDLHQNGDPELISVHGSYYFNRPGPRIYEGIKILAHSLYPSHLKKLDVPDNGFRKISPPN